MNVAPGALVCKEAVLEGNITIGSGKFFWNYMFLDYYFHYFCYYCDQKITTFVDHP